MDRQLKLTYALIMSLLAAVLMLPGCAGNGDPLDEKCFDGIDNDEDGLIDCADPDCTDECIEICDDLIDNNADNLVDCQDPACAGKPCNDENPVTTNDTCAGTSCQGTAPQEIVCSDQIDNDGDNLTDCQDPDCNTKSCNDGNPNTDNDKCAGTQCQGSQLHEANCTDQVDDDFDGLTDCLDPDCTEACKEVCADSTDNDQDQLMDCDDPDCFEDPACLTPCGAGTCPGNQACVANQCQGLEGAQLCDAPEHALVLLDQRLYKYIYQDLHSYIGAACLRRGFGIRILGILGLDNMTFAQVRDLLLQYRQTYPELEGVLFVGNIPMPTFFMSRIDTPQIKYWPRYYEDLDMTAQKTIPDQTVLPACAGGVDGQGYPANWPCIEPGKDFSAPFAVGAHDFDDFAQGDHYGLELWAAFLPVGYGIPAMDNYSSWADQLKPFFQKTLAFYQKPNDFYPNLYHVGNDLNVLTQWHNIWNLIGPSAIDYYAINTLGDGQCVNNGACYVRAPLEDYASLDAFLAYATTLPWMNEGWQKATIFLSHLNSDNHFPRKVVWWNVHSTPTSSIISSSFARTLIQPGKGGIVALLNGCGVGTYQRPGEKLPKDPWGTPYPQENILASLVYGQSAFISAIGSVPLRTIFDDYGVILDSIYVDGYLGLANRQRSDTQDHRDEKPWNYRNHQEILLGDPFVDAQPARSPR